MLRPALTAPCSGSQGRHQKGGCGSRERALNGNCQIHHPLSFSRPCTSVRGLSFYTSIGSIRGSLGALLGLAEFSARKITGPRQAVV
jgi:hypothetical protein